MSPLTRIETLLPLVAGLVWVCVQDIRERRIANLMNAGLALTGLVSWSVFEGTAGATVSGAGCLMGLALGALAYRFRWIGAGDAKLLAAVGAWTGLGLLPFVVVYTALFGGLVSLVVVGAAWRRRELFARPHGERPRAMKVPYGVAIACGTIAAIALAGRPG